MKESMYELLRPLAVGTGTGEARIGVELRGWHKTDLIVLK